MKTMIIFVLIIACIYVVIRVLYYLHVRRTIIRVFNARINELRIKVNTATDKNEVYLLFPELHQIYLDFYNQGMTFINDMFEMYDRMYNKILILEGFIGVN